MNINQLLEITNNLERCAFCPGIDYGCELCDVDPDTAEELRKYYCKVREALTENAKLRSKLKIMQEEYLETCFGECESCRFYAEPNTDDGNVPTEGYCSIRAELKEE